MVEVIVALVILAVGILGLSASAGRLNTAVAFAENEAVALQAVNERMSRILLHPLYVELDSVFTGTESPIDGLPDFTRVTEIDRTQAQAEGGGSVDYTEIKVTVDGPMLPEPISRSAMVAAP